MSEAKRISDEAKRIGDDLQERAKGAAREYQRAAESGFEAANRSFSEVNRSFQAIAAEMTDFSKKSLEDVFRAWEQLLGARSFDEVVDIQTRYARKAYDTYVSQLSKFGELSLALTRSVSKPLEEASKRLN